MNTAYFPISKPMLGSVIPGQLIRVYTRLANYPDHSLEKLIKKRKTEDPVIEFPDMNNQHGAKHPLIQKLQQLMSSKGPRHPHAQLGMLNTPGPRMQEGYQPIRENLDWRKM